MSRVSKEISSMLNATQEDHQAARQLSGWRLQAEATLPYLSALAPLVSSATARPNYSMTLFATASSFPNSNLNFDQQVLEEFMATIVRHYPDMMMHQLEERFAALEGKLIRGTESFDGYTAATKTARTSDERLELGPDLRTSQASRYSVDGHLV